MKRNNILAAVGIIIVLWLVLASPFGERQRSDFGSILSTWGDNQSEASEEITEKVVSPVEGTLVGEHEDNGANWSIPNIIRHILGVSE